MENTIPTLSILFIAVDMLAGIAVPVALYVVLRKRYGCDRLPFFIGCAVMVLFALVLEQLAHSLILGGAAEAGIMRNVWLYGSYGGFMAGLFEESGRYLAFRTVLKKNLVNDRNALMYGAGHGGLEMVYLLFFGMINNFLYCILYNTGNAGVLTAGLTGDALATVEGAFAQLAGAAPGLFLVSLLERCAALVAQVSLSVLVWFAAKKGGRSFWLYPLAVVLHLLLDAGAIILNSYVNNVLLTELAVVIFAALCALCAARVWKREAAAA